jgi:hypothetical protein
VQQSFFVRDPDDQSWNAGCFEILTREQIDLPECIS